MAADAARPVLARRASFSAVGCSVASTRVEMSELVADGAGAALQGGSVAAVLAGAAWGRILRCMDLCACMSAEARARWRG